MLRSLKLHFLCLLLFLLPILKEKKDKQSKSYPNLSAVDYVKVHVLDRDPISKRLLGTESNPRIAAESHDSGYLQIREDNTHFVHLWLKQSPDELKSLLGT